MRSGPSLVSLRWTDGLETSSSSKAGDDADWRLESVSPICGEALELGCAERLSLRFSLPDKTGADTDAGNGDLALGTGIGSNGRVDRAGEADERLEAVFSVV